MEENSPELEIIETEVIRGDLPDLIVRVKAIFLDTLFIVVLMAVFSSLFETMDYEGEKLRVYALLLILLYDPAMVSLGGRIGHRLMKLRVRRFSDESKNPIFPIAIIRFLGKSFLGWLSLITVSSNKSKRAIHDLISNSIVVKLPNKE